VVVDDEKMNQTENSLASEWQLKGRWNVSG
jgi:hypothetical protein